jgi:hypothetical protein
MQTINDRLLAAVFDFCDACESLLEEAMNAEEATAQ